MSVDAVLVRTSMPASSVIGSRGSLRLLKAVSSLETDLGKLLPDGRARGQATGRTSEGKTRSLRIRPLTWSMSTTTASVTRRAVMSLEYWSIWMYPRR